MSIVRSATSKVSVLRSKVLCVLMILSLMGQAVPTLAREPIDVSGDVPSAQQLTASPVISGRGAQAADTYYILEWNIQAVGHQDIQVNPKSRETHHREITIAGSAVSRKSSSGKITTIPMQLTLTDDTYHHYESECVVTDIRTSITDPGRYNGGPDPIWTGGRFLMLLYENGKVSGMQNPFSPEIFDWWLTYRSFNYHTDTKESYCDGSSEHRIYDREGLGYAGILSALEQMPLLADSTGKNFTLDTEYSTPSGLPPLTVKFHATVRTGTCMGLSVPIDISNPAITGLELNLQSQDTTPDDEATLKARVTCQGVPVINAPVVVKLKVKERSGGHNHTGGNRPRGYIDGVEQTANSKFIGITDSNGAVTFAIRPGRDLTDKTRGIAGLYMAEARVEWTGLTSPTERAYINAHRDLVPLPKNDQLYWLYATYIPGVHPEEFYGTPVAVNGIQEMAQDWIAEQELHNWSLSSKGESPWPIYKLEISGISLPQGGLYDKQAYLPGRMWRTPFKQHRFGEDVLLGLSVLLYASPEQKLWYERAFRDLGNEYGTWFTDGGDPYNLKITRVRANLLPGPMLALTRGSGTDPDIATSAALMDPTGRFVTGAGQTVTYSVGVENLVSGTVASQVVLSAALPAGLNFISADPAPSRMEDSHTPIWDIGNLPDEAAPRAFDVIAQVNPSTAVGALLNITATATTSIPDVNPTNDQFSDWGLTVERPGSDLVIGSNLDATALTPGEPVTFTIQLRNDGNAPALNSRLALTVPTGITITKTSPAATVIQNGVRWNAGQLAPGGWQTFTVGLNADPSFLGQAALSPDGEPEYPLAFLMTASSDSTDIDPTSNQMQVDKRVELPGPDLLVVLQAEGTPDPGVFQVGQQVTYTLSYGNFGNGEADVVTSTLLLWPGLTLMGSQPTPTTNQLDPTSGVRRLTWNLGELSVGQEGEIKTRLRVDDVPEFGSIIRANISSNSIDLNPANNVVMETRYKANAPDGGSYRIYLPLIKR